jgi:hypothetical protein
MDVPLSQFSLLYAFACFFGWCRILENEAYQAHEISPEGEREFSRILNRTYKALSAYSYLKRIKTISEPEIAKSTLNRYIIDQIGDLMIKENNNARQIGPPFDVLNTLEFHKQYNKIETRQLFESILDIIEKAKRDSNCPAFNTLLVFGAALQLLINKLDVERKRTTKREYEYYKFMHKEIEETVRKEIGKL